MSIQRSQSSGFSALFMVAALFACAALFVLAPAPVFAQASSGNAPRLLLLPIVVHSSEDPEYLRDGLSDMLAARFDRIGSLELVRPSARDRGATDREEAVKLARKAGVDYVLYGSFTRFGQGASLDVQCAPVSGDKDREPLREIFVHSGSIGEIIPDLDELAGKVSRFARGENVAQAGPASAGDTRATAATNRALQTLTDRVAALEDALQALRDQNAEAGN